MYGNSVFLQFFCILKKILFPAETVIETGFILPKTTKTLVFSDIGHQIEIMANKL